MGPTGCLSGLANGPAGMCAQALIFCGRIYLISISIVREKGARSIFTSALYLCSHGEGSGCQGLGVIHFRDYAALEFFKVCLASILAWDGQKGKSLRQKETRRQEMPKSGLHETKSSSCLELQSFVTSPWLNGRKVCKWRPSFGPVLTFSVFQTYLDPASVSQERKSRRRKIRYNLATKGKKWDFFQSNWKISS